MLNSLKSGNRLRVDFAKNPQKIEIPNLLQLQQNSYKNFLMVDEENRSEAGIEKVFKSIFPLHDAQNRFTLDYVNEVSADTKWRMRELVTDKFQQFLHRYYFAILFKAAKTKTNIANQMKNVLLGKRLQKNPKKKQLMTVSKICQTIITQKFALTFRQKMENIFK
jgi:DNA-directed RNA polymerase beta subunit